MKPTRYEKIREIKNLLLHDARSLEFVRVNITLPKSALEQLDKEFSHMPRSRAIAHLILDYLTKAEEKRLRKSIQTEAEKLAERKDYYASILKTMDTGIYDEDYDERHFEKPD